VAQHRALNLENEAALEDKLRAAVEREAAATRRAEAMQEREAARLHREGEAAKAKAKQEQALQPPPQESTPLHPRLPPASAVSLTEAASPSPVSSPGLTPGSTSLPRGTSAQVVKPPAAAALEQRQAAMAAILTPFQPHCNPISTPF